MSRKTQQQRILDLLLDGFRQRREIGLPEILNLRIGLYNTRIKELRAQGWEIVNRMDAVEGQRRSWYSLKSAIQTPAPVNPSISRRREDQQLTPQKSLRNDDQPALLAIPQQSWADPETTR